MGVEYSHGLFIPDLNYRGTWAHLVAVHDVLVKRRLATKNRYDLYDLDTGATTKLDAEIVAKQPPPNLVATYGDITGQAAVDLMGDSQYGIATKDRYIDGISVLVGVDFKVLLNETYEVEITTHAKNGKKAVKRETNLGLGLHWTYRASWTTTPPKTLAPGTFSGVWRSGVVIECGKDVPSIAADGDPLPAKGFRTALEKAFGTKLVEVGWFH